MATMTFSPGLENVIAAETSISAIDGQAGFLIYRGYDVTELAAKKDFEDVWYLLLNERFPDLHEHEQFRQDVNSTLTLPPVTLDLLHQLSANKDFMALIRMAMSATFTASNLRATIDLSPDEILRDCLYVTAVTPLIVAAAYRITNGQQPINPDPNLSWAANYLYQVTGQMPTQQQILALNRYLILVADHGLNTSTFSARIVCSTGADIGSAVIAAIGALSGPLHGGAPSRVLDMLNEIGDESKVTAWVSQKIESGQKIMGFGHRVYKTYDPRARVLKDTARAMNAPRYNFAAKVEQTTFELFQQLKPGREIATNVEYWSAIVMDAIGLPPELFTPTFLVSRMAGWTSHINEQLQNNRIFRPRAQYVGTPRRTLS